MPATASPPRWAIYVRRSYRTTADADVSDAQQEAAARALVPPGAAVQVISDSGGHHSGRSDQRDGYQALIGQVRAGSLAGLAVYDLSRLARNARLMLELRDELDRHAVALAVATVPGAVFGSATGRYLFGQLALAAQLQADLLADQMRAQLRHTYEAGGHRGHDPYGYASARLPGGGLEHPRRLVAVPAEAALVLHVWQALQRASFEVVAADLNAAGHRHRGGRPWCRDSVKDLWRRGRMYLGYVVLARGADERPGTHPPLLDEATYRATVAAVRARTWAGAKPRPYRTYLLRGRLVCACGARMRGQAHVQRGGERRYYRCPACRAPTGAAPRRPKRWCWTPSAPRCCRPRSSRPPGPSWPAACRAPDAGAAARQRARLAGRLERLRRQHEWGDLDDRTYRAARAAAQADLAALPDGDKLVLFDAQRAVLTTMAANVAAASPAQRQELVGLLVQHVQAADGRRGPGRHHLDAAGPAVLREKTAGVPPRGFEPLISTLKGWRPRPLDDGGAVGRVYAASVPAARSGLSSWSSRSAPGRRRHRAKRPPRWRTDRRTAPRRTPSGRPAHRPRG